MIRTLRITSVIAGLLAVGFLVFFSASGVHGDPAVDRLLQSPTVVEQAAKDKGRSSGASTNPMSRLVDLAQAFANLINPPPPPPPSEGAEGTREKGATPILPPVSGKFRLLATSFNAVDPNLSLAFVEFPTVDRKQSWVRVGQSLERPEWTIRAIKDGAILYGDGQQNQEIAVEERPARVSLLEGGSSPSTAPITTVGPSTAAAMPPSRARPTLSDPATARARAVRRSAVQNAGAVDRPPNLERNIQALEKYKDRLRTLGKDVNDKALSPEMEMRREEMEKMLTSGLQGARMSSQEANSLGDLGRQLDHVQPDTDRDTNNPQ